MIEDDYLLSKIINFPKVFPKYTHDNEKSINPFYYDIEHSPLLCEGESRIWALRTDLIIAVGIKNAYNSARGSTIFDRADSSVRHYIDEDDRYGHPSLITTYDGYDESVYIAGWVYQNKNHIEVIFWSGRYTNEDLTKLQRQQIEQYIALQFMRAWGEQKILFLKAPSEYYLFSFFKGLLSVDTIAYCTYANKQTILQEILYNCIMHYEVDYTLNILSKYPDLKDVVLDSKGNTAFWLFATQGHMLGLDLLRELHIDMNQTNEHQETALHIAAREGNYNLVRLLIHCGLSQLALNAESKTPLDVATDAAKLAFFDTDIICMFLKQKLNYHNTITLDMIELIAGHFYSIDEQCAVSFLEKCKKYVQMICPNALEQYETELTEQLEKERVSGFIQLIKFGYTKRATDMCFKYSELKNVIIDESGNNPLLYFAQKKDARGVGVMLMSDDLDLDYANYHGFTIKNYLALATEDFFQVLDYCCIENPEVALMIARIKYLFVIEKSLNEYLELPRYYQDYYYLSSIFSGADLYKEARQLSVAIRLLRKNWSDDDYVAIEFKYIEFCFKAGIKYEPLNLESYDDFEEKLQHS